MTTDFSDFIAMGQELISENGREIVVLVPGAVESDTPWHGGASANSVKTMGCFLPASGSSFGTYFVTDDLLAMSSEVVLIPAGKANLTKASYIVDDGVQYAVQWMRVLRPANEIVLYAAGLKR